MPCCLASVNVSALQDQEKGKSPTDVAFEGEVDDHEESVVLCARCYSLQHYG